MYTLYQQLMTKDGPRGISTFTNENCTDLFRGRQSGYGLGRHWGSYQARLFSARRRARPLQGAVGFDEIDCPTANPCVPSGPWGMFINSYAPKDEQNSAWMFMQYLDFQSFLKA